MIPRWGLRLKRPGPWIPVFFLSLMYVKLSGQEQWPGCASQALGGSFVCLDGPVCSGQNQACLGYVERSSISMQHARPFLLKELGVSSLSAQIPAGEGALGTSFSTLGLKRLRMSSFWLAYGQQLHPHVSAGLGLHFWNTSVPEKAIYAPGISFALGLQVRIREQWRLGARIFHPVAWERLPDASGETSMQFACGFAYSFFRVARIYADLHIQSKNSLIPCGGVEWILNRQVCFRTGIRGDPLSFSWGISIGFKNCLAEFSAIYRSETGFSPVSAWTYEWH